MLSSSLSDTCMVTWTHLSSLQQRLAYSGEQSPKELRGNVTTQHPAMTKSKIFRMSRHTYPHLVRVRNTNQNTSKPLKPLVLGIEGAAPQTCSYVYGNSLTHRCNQSRNISNQNKFRSQTAVVVRSTFGTQNVKNTSVSEHFWKFRRSKSARRSDYAQSTSAPERFRKLKC